METKATHVLTIKLTSAQLSAIEQAMALATQHGVTQLTLSDFVRDSLAHTCLFFGVDMPRETPKRGKRAKKVQAE